MEWVPFGIVLTLGLVGRLVALRFFGTRVSPRSLALIYAAFVPSALVAIFLGTGPLTLQQGLLYAGIIVFLFLIQFAIADFFFRAFSGEWDKPSKR